jgi:hypothetical protein
MKPDDNRYIQFRQQFIGGLRGTPIGSPMQLEILQVDHQVDNRPPLIKETGLHCG